MSPKISIIIPVYNVEKYLAECLDSCINQTLKEIEIICINDCSPDDSYKILEKYAQIDHRIKIINFEENRGLGAARNTGMAAACGEYVWFIDSDDFIEKEACQLLYDVAHKNNVDILLFQLKTFCDEENGRKYIEDYYYNDLPKNKNLALNQYAYAGENIPVSACSYISRKEFIKNFKFRTGVYFEDTDFTPILLTEAKAIRSLTYTAYNRRQTPGSITRSEMTEIKLYDKLAFVKSLFDYLESHTIDKESYLFKISYVYMRDVLSEIENSLFSEKFKQNTDYIRFQKKSGERRRKIKIFKYIKKVIKCFLPYGGVRLWIKFVKHNIM